MATDFDSAGDSKRYVPVPAKELPNIGPLLFGELDHHIGRQRLQSDRLPDDFLITEDREGRGNLLFEGHHYDLNITVFEPDTAPRGRCKGSGMFVISNGAGVAANTVDQVAGLGPVAGMIDLKRNFIKRKILAALRMVVTARPDVDAILLNMISGIALVSDAVAAVSEFCVQSQGRIPMVLRFNGADMERTRALLRSVVEQHPNVSVVSSTAELVDKAAALLELDPPAAPGPEDMAQWVEEALETRSSFGVTVDPARWLTPERTIERVFGRKDDTPLGILGFGKTTRYRVASMERAGVNVAWAATPTAHKHTGALHDESRPRTEVFSTAREAVAAKGDVGVVINYAPAAHVRDATLGFLAAGSAARLMMIVAENMDYDHIIDVIDALDAAGLAFLGPNCPGVMIVEDGEGRPDCFKIGNMPAHIFERSGGLSFAGRSGTVLFDLVDQATDSGMGIRVAWAIGGDRYTGLGFLDALVLFENDPATRFIVLNCEAGGIQEQLAAGLIATGVISKPVIAMVTGKTVPAGVQYGHPGSTKITEADDPAVKERHLRNVGCLVVQNPTQMVRAIEAIERTGWNLDERRRDALWDRIREADGRIGRRWLDQERAAFDLLHGLVGHWRLHHAHETSVQHLHELVANLTALGVDGFSSLLGDCIDVAAFVAGFDKSREYTAELLRGASEVGIQRFRRFIVDVLTTEAFNAALRTTPWA
ncbi:MAG: hypothetical protein JRI25_20230, partial [Deltaproteobacteria bacterium]|nr:hypothetical protein [Deltaproteobacteria bacterium]